MATTRSQILLRARAESVDSMVADFLFIIPVPANVAVPTPNLPRALWTEAAFPGHGGYTAEEVADFQAGLWHEVTATSNGLPISHTGTPSVDNPANKATVKAWGDAKFSSIVAAEAAAAPLSRLVGMQKDSATTPAWTDIWG